MITATQAAAILGMSARFVYGLGDRGEVVKYQFGKAVRFDEAEIIAYKERSKCQSTSTRPKAGGVSTLTPRPPEAAGTELADYFRKAGRRIKERDTTRPKRQGSTPLQLVSSASRG